MSDSRESIEHTIENEDLSQWARFSRPAGSSHCVWLWQDIDGWHVATTDERAVVAADTRYATEAEALSDFIEDLRRMKRLAGRGHLR